MSKEVFYCKVRKNNLMIEMDRLKSFLSQFNGKRAIVTVEIADEDVSKRFLGWYRKFILPDVREMFIETGLILPMDMVDLRVREDNPVTQRKEYKNGKWINVEPEKLENLSTREMQLFVDHIQIQYAEQGLTFSNNLIF